MITQRTHRRFRPSLTDSSLVELAAGTGAIGSPAMSSLGGSCGGEVTLTTLDDITARYALTGAGVDYAPACSDSSLEGGSLNPTKRLRRWLEKFDPDFTFASALDIPIDDLAASGTKALVLDLENTLVKYKAESLPDEVVAFLDRAHEAGLAVGVVSNSPRAWVEATLQSHDIPYVGMAAKPRKSGFLRVLGKLGQAPANAVHAGDQIITDVYGAHRIGMRAIYIEPIGPEGPISTHIQRKVLMPILNAVRRIVGDSPVPERTT